MRQANKQSKLKVDRGQLVTWAYKLGSSALAFRYFGQVWLGGVCLFFFVWSSPVFAQTESCGSCQSDSWCATNNSQGASCGEGKYRCHPRTNQCVQCVSDNDCKAGETCNSSFKCAPSVCPGSCQSDYDCLQSACGTRTRCISGACQDASDAAGCQPPNLLVMLDNSGSMQFAGNSLVDSKQPCAQVQDCLKQMEGMTPSHKPVYAYECRESSSLGVKTCHYTRWDVAVSSLKTVIHQYGGTPAEKYKDRKIRFGLVMFNSSSQVLAPIFRDPPTLINLLNQARAGGGTRYDRAFQASLDHLSATLPLDVIKRRKTALMFVTDGEPNEGCSTSPLLVEQIYKMVNTNKEPREVKTYTVGFGSGLNNNAKSCLTKLAIAGRTDAQRCDSGTCLSFYVADSAASLLNSFQDIINAATEEVCDGLDNDCDGQIDNRSDGSCNCVKSRTGVTSTLPSSSSTSYLKGVRLYTFLSSYEDGGTCPQPESEDSKNISLYNQACRNKAKQALRCSGTTSEPAGDAYMYYCNRCCGNSVTAAGDGSSSVTTTQSLTCSWGTGHACRTAPWSGVTGCSESCTTWCQDHKIQASDCNMPRGFLRRSGSGYDSSGKLTVLSTTEFGTDVLNKQNKRWLFTLVPGTDPRKTSADQRPLIADVVPDQFHFPTPNGTVWSKPTASWGFKNYQFSITNEQLTATMLGIETQYCTPTTCSRDRADTIGLILGYNEENKTSLRSHRLGAIYHSTPTVLGPPSESLDNKEYLAWVNSSLPNSSHRSYKVSQRPRVVFVGSNDGVMHAFHGETGVELWGYIPQAVLHKLRHVTNGSMPDGRRVYTVDGTPVVANVEMYRYFNSSTSSFVSKWRSVLVFGLRTGGKAYVAIDVTNPYRPRLLWEISNNSLKDPSQPSLGTFDRLAYSFAKPVIAKVQVMWEGKVQERAVAVLAGGAGLRRKGSAMVLNRLDPRQGGVVYLVDLETGRLVREILPMDSERGIAAGKERAIAATPVAVAPLPAVANRLFVADVLGRIFRIDLRSSDPTRWKSQLFYQLFSDDEAPMPVMTAPAIAYNERSELVLFGGTGDLLNINFVTGVNKVFSLREKVTMDSSTGIVKVEAIPNYVAPLHKLLKQESQDNASIEITAKSYTGERLTGTPMVYSGTAYFPTYTPSTELPICGVPGESRVYGIHFDHRCRTGNCFPLAQESSLHYYHRVQAYVKPKRTPLKCCESDFTCGVGEGALPADSRMQIEPNTCGDLHYTVPMLQDGSTAQPYQYYRYLGLGPNTLSMGTQVVFQPGRVQVQRMASISSKITAHSFSVTSPGQMMLAFQIAGRNLAKLEKFKLNRLRAVSLTTNSSLKEGNYATMKVSQVAPPITVASWGSILQ